MAETADTTNTVVSPPHPESDVSTTSLPLTADQSPDESSKIADLKKPGGMSLRIWPPTEKTRDAVTNRLIETLSTESILSKRYGTLTAEEASSVAKSIEEEAYGVASNAVSSHDEDGIKILEVYSKEISKRMLETVKDRSASSAATAAAGNETESTTEGWKTDVTEVSKDDNAPESEKSEA
ncbi:unnamed protein product [Cochlearia groenlandica]